MKKCASYTHAPMHAYMLSQNHKCYGQDGSNDIPNSLNIHKKPEIFRKIDSPTHRYMYIHRDIEILLLA